MPTVAADEDALTRATIALAFEPGEKHWHGASPTAGMSHIAMQEKRDGSPVDWLEQVSDAQYGP